MVLIDIYLAMGSSSESRDLSKLIHFVRSGSIVVHEMQKERGMYAGYLGSGRRNFVLGLPKQRVSLNQMMTLLDARVPEEPLPENAVKLCFTGVSAACVFRSRRKLHPLTLKLKMRYLVWVALADRLR